MVHNGHRVSREWFAPALRVKFQQSRFVQPHCPHSPAATSVADLIVEGVPGCLILAVLWQEVNFIPLALNGNIKTPAAHHVHKTANLDRDLLRGHPSKEDLGRVGRVGTCSSCPDQVQEAYKIFIEVWLWNNAHYKLIHSSTLKVAPAVPFKWKGYLQDCQQDFKEYRQSKISPKYQ